MSWIEWSAIAITAAVLVGLVAWWWHCVRLAEEDAHHLAWTAAVMRNHIQQHAESLRLREQLAGKAAAENHEAHVEAYLTEAFEVAVNRWRQVGMHSQQWMTDIVRKYRAEHEDLAAQRRMDEVEL